ncbi:TonB-dependent receptor [Ottowia sp.]|uniref:TonB-dependent receptor n=1 Tax=Ottowia sp. TaxID=1898956 RepID=UPI003A858DB0
MLPHTDKFSLRAGFDLFRLHSLALASTCMLMAISTSASGQTTDATSASLPEVTVKSQAESLSDLPPAVPGGKVATGARLGIMGNVDVMDAPFNITSYTAEAIEDEQAQTLADVLRKDPSVRTMTNEGHLVENFIIRGFPLNSESIAINGMYGLAPLQSVPTEMFERIELLKGPGAMLMGVPPTGDVGGAINLVPKRAGRQPITRLTTSYSSKSSYELHADLARRFGEEQRLGIRFNGAYGDGGTALDHQKVRRTIGALAMDYQGNNWKVAMDAYSLTTKARDGVVMQPIFQGAWTSLPDAPDGSTNFFHGDDVFTNMRTRGVIVRGEAKLTSQWTAFAGAGTARQSYDGFIYGTRPVWNAANADTGAATGTVYNSWGKQRAYAYELGVRGEFSTGAVKHALTLSANQERRHGGIRGNGTWSITDSNIYNPTMVQMPVGADASTYRETTKDVSSALSVVDTLSMLDDRLRLTLGVRHQKVRQKMAGYDESAVTPMVGVVAKPWGDDISLYANYIQGLSAGQVVSAPYINEGETLAPYKSKQGELGIKWRWNELTQTVSLFQITKPAVITTADNAQQADGEQRNRGVEWNVFGKLTRDVGVQGGVTYTKAEHTKTQGGTNQGNTQYGVPKWLANLGVDWAIPAVQGLTLSGRVNYTGSMWLTTDNQVKLPSWTTVDLGVRYATKVAGQPVVLRGLVTNVANKKYWEGLWGGGRANLGAPRTYHVSATFDF